MKFKINIRNVILYILTFIVVLAGDLITKAMVDNQMALGDSISIIKNFFNFTYVHNTGAAWGSFAGYIPFFLFVALIASIAIVYYFLKSTPKEKFLRFGLVLVFSGLLGNVYDRLMLGYVRDFIDFIILGYDFPIFNIADMGVVIGMFFVLLEIGLGEFQTWKNKQ